MKSTIRTTSILLATAVATTAGCTSSPGKIAEPATIVVSSELPSDRYIASDNYDGNFQEHFETIMSSNLPNVYLIGYLQELYTLLIMTNKDIGAFEASLDIQLAKKRLNPNFQPQPLLENGTYRRLMKMWLLKDKYIAEISYFYYRLLWMRTEKGADGKHTAQAKAARLVQLNLEKYVNGSQDTRRVEFQELLQHLREVFVAFTTEYKKSKFSKRDEVNSADSENGESLTSTFTEALFESPAALEQYIKEHNVQMIPKMSAQEVKDGTRFLKNVMQKLNEMPEVTADGQREPQSITAQVPQDNGCSAGRKLCVSPGDSGNIIGSLLPKGYWAFTFDDGPVKGSSKDMMELVHSYHDSVNPQGKATFFQLAKSVKANLDLVQLAFDYGFPVANHSYTHADLHASATDLHHEIQVANDDLTKAYHTVNPTYQIQYFRCPYGSCYAPKVPKARQMIADQGQIHVYWRIDSLDWKLLNAQKVADLVEKQIQLMDHGVILMHDIHPTTVGAMRIILPWLKDQNDRLKKNYRMVTIPEVVDLINGTTK